MKPRPCSITNQIEISHQQPNRRRGMIFSEDSITAVITIIFVHNFWHIIQNYKTYKETEKYTYDKEENINREDPHITQLLELAGNNFKIIVINMLNNLVRTMHIIEKLRSLSKNMKR